MGPNPIRGSLPKRTKPLRVKMWGVMEGLRPGEGRMKVGEVRRGIRLISRGENGVNEIEFMSSEEEDCKSSF